MLLTTILDIANPLTHWTGAYTGSTISDRFSNHVLTNDGCTLGEDGNLGNRNYSDKSINLIGGRLLAQDNTFINTQLANRVLAISFAFKTDTPTGGFKYIISKWTPENQFLIGIENDQLVAKIQTAGGLVELSIGNSTVLYSGRWNYATLLFRANDIILQLNGDYDLAATTDTIDQSILSTFTVGDIGANAFTTDFYISDISICEHTSHNTGLASYRLPRSEKEIYLDAVPLYYYDFANDWLSEPNEASPNLGTAGDAPGTLRGGRTVNITYPDTYTNQPYNEFASDSFFHIGGSLDFSESVDGWMSVVSLCQGDAYNDNSVNHRMRMIDWSISRANQGDRIIAGFGSYVSGGDYYLLSETFDSGGTTILREPTSRPNTGEANNFFDAGLVNMRFNSSTLDYRKMTNAESSIVDTVSNSLGGFTPSVPLEKLQCFYSDGVDGANWFRAANVAIYPYKLSDSKHQFMAFNSRRFVLNMLFDLGYLNHYSTGTSSNAFGVASSGVSTNLHDQVSGSLNSKTIDELNNRPNDMTACVYFDNTSTERLAQSWTEDNNDVGVGDFSVGFMIHNLNQTDRYRVLIYTYNNSSYLPQGGTNEFEVFVNSRDGAFSLGDIEFAYNGEAVGYVISTTSQKLTNEGFHHVVWVREGTENRLYIDGELELTFNTAGTHNLDQNSGSNTAWMFFGKNTYLSDMVISNDTAFSEDVIKFAFWRVAHTIAGTCLLDAVGVESEINVFRKDTGHHIESYGTAPDGTYSIILPKNQDFSDVMIAAVPVDDTVTNHVVVHGPYSIGE